MAGSGALIGAGDKQRLEPRRREFVSGLIGLTRKAERRVAGEFVNDSFALGHRLRDRAVPASAGRTVSMPIVIVGGGIAGLSAAWHLDRRGFRDFVLLEMEREPGGNSRYGENDVSAYPWAAHYIPVPGTGSRLVRELLQELGVVNNGVWEERYLCFSPQERLYIHGRWQEGIEPELGATARDREDFRRFEELIAEQRQSRQFTIPIADGARASELDSVSMSEWLARNGLTSPALRWYVDYSCRDDYGAAASATSAWAGIHYFASREPDEKGPLTWPEGNGWIVRRLAAKLARYIRTGTPVTSIRRIGSKLQVSTPDTMYAAEAVVFAAPTFLAPYLIEGAPRPPFEYSPWVTANLTLDRLPRERGVELAWDNVIYGSASLGYVNATHMSLATRRERTVWTWYHALSHGNPADNRRLLLQQDCEYWKRFILDDLSRAHPDIRECVSRIDVMRMGHAMARPSPGFLSARRRERFDRGVRNVFFGNSDISGVSIFEEAQYCGVHAAGLALRSVSR